ncbi:MAG: PIG-L family deacetylase, partial [Anaerolineales bacterium]|nr:PIG-L family deacetylase [Anaerolineales bacterium]
MPYDLLIITAHPDDAEVQMGGTLAKLTAAGQTALIVDLCDGEPADYAPAGVRREQAMRAAKRLGADRLILDQQDRFITDTIPTRLALAKLIREHRPRTVFAATEACVHPDHAAVGPLATAAVFYARLQNWDRVPGGEALAGTDPWVVARLFFPHCKMEPAWGDYAFAVDVSATYAVKQAALAEYQSLFKAQGDQLLELYEAEDLHMGRIFGVAYAEVFKSHSPLLVAD